MNKKIIQTVAGIIMLVFVGLITGCNLPGSPEPTQVPSDVIYTMAAGTVIAHYTQEAEGTMVAIETPPTVQTIIPTEPAPTIAPTDTVEPTTTSTPTETPTNTAIPATIYEDDFSNTSRWYVAEEDDFSFGYQDGTYRVTNDLLNGAVWSIRYQEYDDIRIEVDAIRLAGPDDSYYGVVCRLKNDGDDYYALVINDSGFYGIMKMEDSEQEFLATGTDGGAIINKGKGETNRIRGVCLGEQLTLFANDQKLLEISDDDLSDGNVGLVVGNRLSGVGIEVIFDNFALIRP